MFAFDGSVQSVFEGRLVSEKEAVVLLFKCESGEESNAGLIIIDLVFYSNSFSPS